MLIVMLIGINLSCSSSKTSVVTADSYDKTKDQTTLGIIPYGNISMNGKWTKTSYNEVSQQHFFMNDEGTSIAITKAPKERYPFYIKNLTDYNFIEKFYQREFEHYSKQDIEIDKIETDKQKNYIIWKATGNNINTTFLYGAKNNLAYNFSVMKGNWSDEKKIEFLKKIFNEN